MHSVMLSLWIYTRNWERVLSCWLLLSAAFECSWPVESLLVADCTLSVVRRASLEFSTDEAAITQLRKKIACRLVCQSSFALRCHWEMNNLIIKLVGIHARVQGEIKMSTMTVRINWQLCMLTNVMYYSSPAVLLLRSSVQHAVYGSTGFVLGDQHWSRTSVVQHLDAVTGPEAFWQRTMLSCPPWSDPQILVLCLFSLFPFQPPSPFFILFFLFLCSMI